MKPTRRTMTVLYYAIQLSFVLMFFMANFITYCKVEGCTWTDAYSNNVVFVHIFTVAAFTLTRSIKEEFLNAFNDDSLD